jgi:hypothetical protein
MCETLYRFPVAKESTRPFGELILLAGRTSGVEGLALAATRSRSRDCGIHSLALAATRSECLNCGIYDARARRKTAGAVFKRRWEDGTFEQRLIDIPRR